LRGGKTVLQFRILGPFEVVEGDRPVRLGGPKQRALLALLLLHRGEAVSVDRLIDGMWGERPPASAAKTVQVYVSNLRKALGDEVLVTGGGGYLLTAAPGQVDVDRFETLVADGRDALERGDARKARDLLRDALTVWRGPPLADFAYEPFAQSEIARLEEAHAAAIEERIDADLALGRDGDLVGELQMLVCEQPLRERPRRQLMLALYRSGRQAEALETYRDARRVLSEELGLEPGPELRLLEQAILKHDPTLLARPGRSGSVRPTAARGVRRGGLLLLAAALGAVLLSLGGGGTVRPDNAAVAIDARTGRVISYTPVGTSPTDATYGEGSVWVLNADDRTVSRIDPRTRQVTSTFAIGGIPTELAVGDGAVWVGSGTSTAPGLAGAVYTSSISRIDPRSASAVGQPIQLPVGNSPCACAAPGVSAIAIGPSAVWAVNPDQSVSRVDPRTGRIVAIVRVPNAAAVAVGAEGVWVVRGGLGGHADQPSHQPARTDNPRGRDDACRDRAGRRLCVGERPDRRDRVANRSRPATGRENRVGQPRHRRHRVRRRQRVDNELHRRHELAHRPGNERGRADPPGGGHPAGSHGRRRHRVGVRRRRLAQRFAPGVRVRAGRRGWPQARPPDRLGRAAPGAGRGERANDGRRGQAGAGAARLQGREVHRRLSVLRRLDRTGRRLRLLQVWRERQGLRGGRAARGRDRPVQLGLRAG
jgi:DNA-binding SARP family transcriptional activator